MPCKSRKALAEEASPACGSFAGISLARLCIALHSGATGALGQFSEYSYLAMHFRTTNQGVVGSNPACVVAIAVFMAGCGPATEPGAVGIERPQLLLVPSEQVNQGADEAYQQVLAQARGQGALDRDPAQVRRVKAIVGRLIPQTTAFRKDAPGWEGEADAS